jgi:hypothetical protein
MAQASYKIVIHASLLAIWTEISNFGAAGPYLHRVVDCTADGDGVGAQRTLAYADGSTITERLETLDESAHRFCYIL